MTNVVKHFKWEAAQRGKQRIHKKPKLSEIEACRPWLDAELEVTKPEVLVCLGASAAQSLLDKDFRVTRDRGTPRKKHCRAVRDGHHASRFDFAGARQRFPRAAATCVRQRLEKGRRFDPQATKCGRVVLTSSLNGLGALHQLFWLIVKATTFPIRALL